MARDTIACINDRGLIEIVDIYTGTVISVQESQEDLLKTKQERMTPVQQPDGSILYLERGVSLDSYVRRPKWTYSDVVMDIICQKIMEGKTLTSICQEPGMPPFWVLSQWRRKFPHANEMIVQA